MPGAELSDLHLVLAEVNHTTITGNERARRGDVRRAVDAANLVEHQLSVVVELNGEPIPTLLAFSKLGAAEFVVHPGLAGGMAAVDPACGLDPGHRVACLR